MQISSSQHQIQLNQSKQSQRQEKFEDILEVKKFAPIRLSERQIRNLLCSNIIEFVHSKINWPPKVFKNANEIFQNRILISSNWNFIQSHPVFEFKTIVKPMSDDRMIATGHLFGWDLITKKPLMFKYDNYRPINLINIADTKQQEKFISSYEKILKLPNFKNRFDLL